MSPDPFFSLDPEQICKPAPECQKVCPWAEPPGFCGARIHPECLRITDDGLVRVGLSVSARAWFATLTQLGNVLHVSRNRIAALGQLGSVPDLTDWRNPVLPRDHANSFTPNLGEYAGLWAAREGSPIGVAYGLESHDVSGHAFHRAFLTSTAQRELFDSFVIDHQSPPAEAGYWFSPNHGASVQRCHVITNRIPLLRSRLAKGAKDARQLSNEFIPCLLAAAAAARLPIRTTHYNRALTQAVVWTPDGHESLSGEKRGVEFLQGEGVGLHIHLPAVGGVWLWQGQCSCCSKDHWTIEIADANDEIGLAVTAGDEVLEPHWRALLNDCLP
jgi:hypothetical protein